MVRTVRFLWCDPYEIPGDLRGRRPGWEDDESSLEPPLARRSFRKSKTAARKTFNVATDLNRRDPRDLGAADVVQ